MQCAPGHTIHNSLPAMPYHIPGHARQAILHTMPSPMPCLPGNKYIPCDARQAIPYTMCCPPGLTIPCDACKAIPYPMPGPPDHTIIPSDARQAILYSMRGPLGHTIHYAMPCIVRPYHILCHARQAMPFSCHACHDIPYTMPCPLGHTTYHAIPTRSYHIHVPCQPGHTIYHAIPRQAIPYTMPYYFG